MASRRLAAHKPPQTSRLRTSRLIELRTADGSSYTGLVMVERNAPVIMIAVRQLPGPTPERPAVLTPPPVQRPLYGHDRLDPDAPHWDRDSGPYGSGPYGR